ncbi:hypothetical protein K2Z83_06805 [Oscillochloris sp. ZM17-4]|uniref:hypothetical protein n=1 Tax=Oscillochloris sp. ZM17-4 TaxID=2866714 RepID=UPI001C738472|nr:hypothetical protein [Oscillochloris sp. ZM17-4]MBX0327384.1 hypothetical protein [Oscillochloris sp. ZM17-4]
MPLCDACGQENRDSARFCWSCAARMPAFRPSDSDRQWLASTLESPQLQINPPATDDTAPLRLRETPATGPGAEEEAMEDQNPEAP